jgi:hypothetical protein
MKILGNTTAEETVRDEGGTETISYHLLDLQQGKGSKGSKGQKS